MRYLVVGGGGREHAVVRSLVESDGDVLCAPGNPGIAAIADVAPVDVADVAGIVSLARERSVDVVVPGPEAPLVAGLGDALAEAGIPCAGPSAAAARLEGSKAFTRILADHAGVPSPRYAIITAHGDVDAAVGTFPTPPVVKADGLAAGKGVILSTSKDAARQVAREILDGRFGEAGRKVVLEERLLGVEASLFYACRGTEVIELPDARDHKRLLDGDSGPNTGGMGAVSPNPTMDREVRAEVLETVILPTLATMEERGDPFTGFLFAGLMLTDDGPRLLEYNVRLGDPEAQVVVPRLPEAWFAALCAWLGGAGDHPGPIDTGGMDPVCAVVLAAAGYPDEVRVGDEIEVGAGLESNDRWLIHAATWQERGRLTTAGGRVAAVVARGSDPGEARRRAYDGVALVRWDGMQYRTDIGE